MCFSGKDSKGLKYHKPKYVSQAVKHECTSDQKAMHWCRILAIKLIYKLLRIAQNEVACPIFVKLQQWNINCAENGYRAISLSPLFTVTLGNSFVNKFTLQNTLLTTQSEMHILHLNSNWVKFDKQITNNHFVKDYLRVTRGRDIFSSHAS